MGGEPDTVVSRDSLANPGAFDWFVAYAAERGASVG
jgi:acetoacetyl-CoA synthetase